LIILGKKFLRLELSAIKPKADITDSEKRIIHLIKSRSIMLIFFSAISLNLLNNLDVIFVKKFFSPDLAGIYGGWNLFSKIIYYILGPILSLSFIFFSDKQQKKSHSKVLYLTLALFFVAGGILYLLYFFLKDFLVLLIFSKDFQSISPLLPQAAIFGILYCLIVFLNGFFIAKNSLRSLAITVYIIFYGTALYLFGKNLVTVININIIFSLLITISYFLLIFLKIKPINKTQDPF